MKNLIIIAVALVSFVIFFIGCGYVYDVDTGRYMYVGLFSYPTIYISDGANNFSNPYNMVTGNSIKDATVTVSNETTGVSTPAVWVERYPRGFYFPQSELVHLAGQKVSLKIVTSAETITGDPTVTPNPMYSNLSPASNATATLPFNVSWDIAQGTVEATHSYMAIASATTTNEVNNYQVVVPIAQKSVQITSSNIARGSNYSIFVVGVNSMKLNKGKSGSVVYVGGGDSAVTTNITIESQ